MVAHMEFFIDVAADVTDFQQLPGPKTFAEMNELHHS